MSIESSGRALRTNGAVDEWRIRTFLSDTVQSVDVDAVVNQWKAARCKFEFGPHTLPMPVWDQRKFEHTGVAAWKELSSLLPRLPTDRAISIYCHVPFCSHKCGFCDCYSMVLPESNRRLEDEYVTALVGEMDVWRQFRPLSVCPVTTVHFGGGTPNHLTHRALSRIIEKCRASFGTSPQTEWALESTSSLLSREHLAYLNTLGFTRLHVGVQTLEDPLRKLLGRRETGDVVVEKLAYALEIGFTTSVDILYAVPGQTAKMLLADLQRLTALGVHGFSLYCLQFTQRNRALAKRVGTAERDPLKAYTLFQAGAHYLTKNGYLKNHFTHFAREQDQNLYYRHALRGEDLLSLGPIADGRFGSYVYRHPEYRKYTNLPSPALQGGMFESPSERKTWEAKVALMSGSITYAQIQKLGAEPLLELWLAGDLLEECQTTGFFELTANGSWFISSMIKQIDERVATSRERTV